MIVCHNFMHNPRFLLIFYKKNTDVNDGLSLTYAVRRILWEKNRKTLRLFR